MPLLKHDYGAIVRHRQDMLNTILKYGQVEAWIAAYREAPWMFVRDWGWTYEPRNAAVNMPVFMPFMPWPKQIEYLKWVDERLAAQERGLVDKSRDCGVTWLSCAFAWVKWLFEDGYSIGFGSRKLELVDTLGDPDCIFEKIRMLIRMTPPCFLPDGWDERKYSNKGRLVNPANDNTIVGEGGDQIGRGGRATIYFVDEAAFCEHQDSIDAALSQTTDCQIDISTVNGSGNAYYRKLMRFDNTPQKFVFDWRDDPRKDADWYEKQKRELDPVIVAQEIDRDPDASTEDIFLPAEYVRACVDAHITLGFRPEGLRKTGFDPADVGDAKAVAHMHGSVLTDCAQRKEGDITSAIPWAYAEADNARSDVLIYDADGMGAPTMKLTLHHKSAGRMKIVGYHGSAGVIDPGGRTRKTETIKQKHQDFKEGRAAHLEGASQLKTNADSYGNFKAQSWVWMRNRMEATYHAVQASKNGQMWQLSPEDVISISSQCRDLQQLTAELSRPKRVWKTNTGLIYVESKIDMRKRGVQSPNLAEAFVMANSYNRPIEFAKPEPPPMPRFLDDNGMSIDGVM